MNLRLATLLLVFFASMSPRSNAEPVPQPQTPAAAGEVAARLFDRAVADVSRSSAPAPPPPLPLPLVFYHGWLGTAHSAEAWVNHSPLSIWQPPAVIAKITLDRSTRSISVRMVDGRYQKLLPGQLLYRADDGALSVGAGADE